MRVDVTLGVLKLGLIGCGRIAQVAHLPAIEKTSGVELVAVCDPSREIAQCIGERFGVPHVTGVDSMLGMDVDAVLIATPDRFHVELAVRALEAGKHVLVEKPVAMNVAEAQKLIPVVADSVLTFQVGSMKRHDPGIEFAAAALAERRLGRILSATAWYRVMAGLRRPIEDTLFPRVVTDPVVADLEQSLKRASAEDHLLRTHGIHTFDLMRYLLGEVRVTSAEMASVHGEWSEGWDIYGELGHLSLRQPFPFSRQPSQVTVFDEYTSRYEMPVFGHSDPYRRQLEAFAAAVRDGRRGSPDLADGIAALELVDEVHRLSKATRQVDDPSVTHLAPDAVRSDATTGTDNPT
jgi:predicted dehydrogenase